MGLGIIGLISLLVILAFIKFLTGKDFKIAGITLLVLTAVFTIWVCIQKPEMHKPFAVNAVEHLIKVNKDGSITDTTQVIQTVYEEETK